MQANALLLSILLPDLLVSCGVLPSNTSEVHAARDPRFLLSSKVTYKHRTPFKRSPKLSDVEQPNGCEAVFLYLVSRHGTRWPTTHRWKQMRDLSPILQKSPRVDEYPWMMNWEPCFDDKTGNLHPIGKQELSDLATRLQRSFPDLLKGPFTSSRFFFQSTNKSRTIDSAAAFASTLFKCTSIPDCVPTEDPLQMIYRSSLENDNLLRFYKLNATHVAASENFESLLDSWAAETIYPSIRSNLEERLGFEAQSLPLDVVDAVWSLCKTQASLQDNVDEACSLLSEEDILTLSWLDDESDFLTNGQGSSSRCAVAEPLVTDLTYWLKKVSQDYSSLKDSNAQSARFHFAHSNTIYLLLCLLDLGDQHPVKEPMDKPPPFHLISRNIDLRFWEAAKITPMAGNFVAVLYRCNVTFKVRFIWNEQVLLPVWCDGLDCDLDIVIQKLQDNRIGACPVNLQKDSHQ